jgi:TolB-like protein
VTNPKLPGDFLKERKVHVKTREPWIRTLLRWGICFLFLWGCAGHPEQKTYVKDGVEYGKVKGTFRHRWWNYYERGLSFQEGRYFQEAAGDFKEAIQGRDKDQRMARSYGMHFIDYFPHRELGIVYYEMGDLELARGELEVSLAQYPSAKARYYLDRVRKGLIERRGAKGESPLLSLDFETDEVWTRDDPVLVSGVAEDEQYVSEILLGGVPLFLEGSEKRAVFKKALKLSDGVHPLEIEARNLAGGSVRHPLLIHVDRQGPTISVEAFEFHEEGKGTSVTVKGSVYDEAGVDVLRINGREMVTRRQPEVLFSEEVAGDRGLLDLTARDRLGNETRAGIPLSPHTGNQKAVLLSCAVSGPNIPLLAGLFGDRDIRPPVIELKGWTEEQIVYLKKIYIEGRVRDENSVTSLTINGTPLLNRKGRYIFFNHLEELREGRNTISVVAGDEAGNTAKKEIVVEMHTPQALRLEERMRVTVLPFEQKGMVSKPSLSFQDNLIHALITQNRFQVVERDLLDLILQEQKLSQTELIDRGTALKVGKLLTAQSIITGSVIETLQGIEFVARLVDTETSEILATEDAYGEVKDLPGLRTLAEGMAIKFHRDVPLVEGVILEKKGKSVFIDLGQNKIRFQRRIIVYKEEPVRHPLTGRVLGADYEVTGRARVTQVGPEMSKAELIAGQEQLIHPLDKVITE